MRTTFLIRTHRWDTVVADLARTLLGAGMDVLVTADMSGGAFDTGGVEAVCVTPALAHPAPPPRPKDWGWLCGDLCLYAGLDARPDAERFVLIDGDVQIGAGALPSLLRRIEATGAEALAAELLTHGADKRLSRGLSALGRPVDVGCLFPFVIVSRRVAEAMRALRQEIIAHRPGLRINDEAVLASVVRDLGVAHGDLRAWDDLFSRGTFGVEALHLHAPREGGGVWHPVMPFGAALRRVAGGDRLTVRRLARADAVPSHMRAALDRAEASGGQAGQACDEATALRIGALIEGLPAFEGVRLNGVEAPALRWLGQAWDTAEADLSATPDQRAVAVAAPVDLSDGGEALAKLTAEAEAAGLDFHALRDVALDGSRTTGATAWFVRPPEALGARALAALAVIAGGVLEADDLVRDCLDTAGARSEATPALLADRRGGTLPSDETVNVRKHQDA